MAHDNELLPRIPSIVVDESFASQEERDACEQALLESRKRLLQQELERLQAPLFRQSFYYRERRACCMKMLELVEASIDQLRRGQRPPAPWSAELETLFSAMHLDSTT